MRGEARRSSSIARRASRAKTNGAPLSGLSCTPILSAVTPPDPCCAVVVTDGLGRVRTTKRSTPTTTNGLSSPVVSPRLTHARHLACCSTLSFSSCHHCRFRSCTAKELDILHVKKARHRQWVRCRFRSCTPKELDILHVKKARHRQWVHRVSHCFFAVMYLPKQSPPLSHCRTRLLEDHECTASRWTVTLSVERLVVATVFSSRFSRFM